jgi:hypothetical protein
VAEISPETIAKILELLGRLSILIDRASAATEPQSFSMATYKRLALNGHLLERFISMLGLDPTLIKSHPNYEILLQYGSLAP